MGLGSQPLSTHDVSYCFNSVSFSRGAVVSYWRKYVHEVLVNRLGGLSLPRKSVVRLTDRPDMTVDVYRGRKTTIQQQLSVMYVLLFSDRQKERKWVIFPFLKLGRTCIQMQAMDSFP